MVLLPVHKPLSSTYSMFFLGTRIERLPSPYTNCVEDKFIWNNDEYISTQYACRKLCLTMVILEKCKCMPETITPYHYKNIGKYIQLDLSFYSFYIIFIYLSAFTSQSGVDFHDSTYFVGYMESYDTKYFSFSSSMHC